MNWLGIAEWMSLNVGALDCELAGDDAILTPSALPIALPCSALISSFLSIHQICRRKIGEGISFHIALSQIASPIGRETYQVRRNPRLQRWVQEQGGNTASEEGLFAPRGSLGWT